MVVIGAVERLENKKYRLVPEKLIVEQRVVSDKEGSIYKEDLASAIDCVEKKYCDNYLVMDMFDRNLLMVNHLGS